MNTVNKMTGNMTALKKTVQDAMSMQIHTSSDTLQETLARLGKINQQLVDLQKALRGIDGKLAHSAPAATPAPAARSPQTLSHAPGGHEFVVC